MTLPFSLYDQRAYDTVDPLEGYNAWAAIYDTAETDFTGWMTIDLLQQLETVQWERINTAADLACGTGRIGQWLREEKGIAVLDGVDLSPHMLVLAQEKQVYRTALTESMLATSLPASAYNLVINSLAACHIAQLDQLYGEAARLLQENGYFLLADYHPFFLINGIPTHVKCPDGTDLAIENWVHFFSDHVSAGTNFGFRLLEMKEQLVFQKWVDVAPSMAKYLHQPVSFVLVWKKS